MASVTELLEEKINNGLEFIKENPITTAVGAAGIGTAAGIAASSIITNNNKGKTRVRKSKRSRKKRAAIKHTRRGWKQDRARRSKQPWEVAYRKRKAKRTRAKSKSRRGAIHYARKTGQPYIILQSGKAKFIKGKRRKR